MSLLSPTNSLALKARFCLNRDKVERVLLDYQGPRPDIQIINYFAPGVYVREMKAPANSLILGHEHTTLCTNIILEGEVDVCVNGNVCSFKAGDVFISSPESWKLVHVKKDLRFLNVFPNPDDTQDMAILESRFIKKSEQFLNYEEEKKLL